MLTTPENLAQVVLQSLRNSSADDSETTMFTIRLKRDLDAFYRSLSNHADIRYTRREHEKREFLLDLCVIEDHCMDTAVESEWQPDIDAIHYDFEKLLHVKAPLKVLICDSRNYVVEKMKPAVDFLFTRRGSLTPGEVYMIFNYRGNRAFANCHVWTVSDNVLDPSSISFQCVPGFPAEVNNKASIHADGWLA